MGWLFSSEWSCKKDVEQHLVKQLTHSDQVVLDTSSSWGEFYALCERKGERFIVVFLIKGTKASRHKCAEFGYKDMCESMNPYYYNCPERILSKSTDMSEGAVEWRAACRKIRKEKSIQTKILKGLKAGEKVMTSFGELVFMHHYKTTQFIAQRVDNGKTFRYNLKHIKVDA